MELRQGWGLGWGRTWEGRVVTFEYGVGPRLRTQLEKALGVGSRWGNVQAWGGVSA